jgi:hypothetical protein
VTSRSNATLVTHAASMAETREGGVGMASRHWLEITTTDHHARQRELQRAVERVDTRSHPQTHAHARTIHADDHASQRRHLFALFYRMRPSRASKTLANQRLHVPDVQLVLPNDVSDEEGNYEQEEEEESLPNNAVAIEDFELHDLDQAMDMDEASGEENTGSAYRWRKHVIETPPSGFTGLVMNDSLLDPRSAAPAHYFRRFISDALIDQITFESNLYSTQSSASLHSAKISKAEMEQFLGILLIDGVLAFPQYRMHWQPESRTALVADHMSRNRFDQIKQCLHFNNNLLMPGRNSPSFNKLYKVQPIVDAVRDACNQLVLDEELSVDEQMIPTKSRSPVRQYMPNKPNKWGVKVWVLASTSGLIFDFQVYTGKSSQAPSSLGCGGDVVMQLASRLPDGCHYRLAFDNYFTSIPLLKQLKEKGILAVGTIRGNRLRGAAALLKTEKMLKKEGRGSHDWRADQESGVTIIRWLDRSIVQIASNYLSGEAGEEVQRFSQQQKTMMTIPCPQMVQVYNKGMGGVDLADQLLSYYRVHIKTKKWYRHVFFHLLSVAVVNSWLLYRRDCDFEKMPQQQRIPLIKFQMKIAESLIRCGKAVPQGRKRLREDPVMALLKTPEASVRLDRVDHFPVFLEKQQRCKLCAQRKSEKGGFTFIQCTKCCVSLCLTREKNCFYDFHHM